MKNKGFEGQPFQLLIGIIVFSMALVIGNYLFDMINCWKCTELLHIEATTLREAIASVGKGDIHSKKNLLIEMENLGSCAKGIFIKHLSSDAGLSCRSFCPNHPNSCWVIVSSSRCGGDDFERDCIDVSGDLRIESADSTYIGKMDSNNPWMDDAYVLAHSLPIKIEKVGPREILIGQP